MCLQTDTLNHLRRPPSSRLNHIGITYDVKPYVYMLCVIFHVHGILHVSRILEEKNNKVWHYTVLDPGIRQVHLVHSDDYEIAAVFNTV